MAAKDRVSLGCAVDDVAVYGGVREGGGYLSTNQAVAALYQG